MTISRSNFVVISIVLVAVLFLFQFSNISAQYTSQATTNKHAKPNIQISAKNTLSEDTFINPTEYSTAIIKNYLTQQFSTIVEWCTYSKRTYQSFDSIDNFYENLSRSCKLLILNGEIVASDEDINTLQIIAERGIHIIFTSLPNTAIIESSPTLCELLGIRTVKTPSFKTNGMTLYEGFFLGGQKTYKHMKEKIPYFILQTGTKKYMVGEIKNQKEKKIKNEELPPVIWRNAYQNSFIFSINADFAKDHTLLGLLTSMWSETDSYYIYPIVNAQSIVLQNFPYLANENKENIQKQYYYTPKNLSENVIWPDVASILNATKDSFTGMIAPQLEYKEDAATISKSSIDFYFKQTERISGELGISGDMISQDKEACEKKIHTDTRVMKDYVSQYTYTIFEPGNMPESVYGKYLGNQKQETVLSSIRTVVKEKESAKNILQFYNNDILCLSNTIDGFSHSDREDFYMRSLETALGYSSVGIDFKRVLYPESIKDDWTKLSKKLSSYLTTHWSVYRKAFDQTTISQADLKARQFLAVNYNAYRYNDTINLSVTNLIGNASFILNLSNEKIDTISGGTYQKIEHNRYQITVNEPDVVISVSPDTDWRSK